MAVDAAEFAGALRVSAATATPVRAPARAPARRWRAALRSPVVAVLGVVLVLGGAGAAAAGDWLQVFRTERVAAVPGPPAHLVGLPHLSPHRDLQPVTD